MKSLFSIACILLIALWPQIGAPQTTTAAAKIFCPQCGVGNKPAAKFCLQCGTSLPKPTPVSQNLLLPVPSQPAARIAGKTDSTELVRREFIRLLVTDPEFNRMLNLRIQSAMREASTTHQTAEVTKSKSNPIGAFFTFVGGLTCTLLVIGLIASL